VTWDPFKAAGGFLPNFGHVLENVWGVAEHGFGAASDFITDTPGDYNPTTGQTTSEWDKMLASFGGVLHYGKEMTGPFGEVVSDAMKADQWLYSNGVSRPLSTVLLMGDYAGSPNNKWFKGAGKSDVLWNDPVFNTGTVGALFDPDAWSSAWSRAKHVSPGQALVGGLTTDMSDDQKIRDVKQDWWFGLASGAFDASASLTLDPLGKLGKVLKFTRALHSTEELSSVTSRMGRLPTGVADAAPAVKSAEDLPITNYDDSSLNRIRGHLGHLSASQLEDLYHYERTNQARPNVMTMLENRYKKVGDQQFAERSANPLGYVPPGLEKATSNQLKTMVPTTAESVAKQTSQTSPLFDGKNQPMFKALNWMQDKSDTLGRAAAKKIEAHPLLRDVPGSGLIASMYADADYNTKVLVTKIGLGDVQAYKQVDNLNKSISLRLLQLNDARADLMRAEGRVANATDKGLASDRLGTVQAEIDSLENQQQIFAKALGKGDGVDNGILGLMPNVMKGSGTGGLALQGIQKALVPSKSVVRNAAFDKLEQGAQALGGTSAGQKVTGALGALNAGKAGLSTDIRNTLGTFRQAGNFDGFFTHGAFYYNGYNVPLKIIGSVGNITRKVPQGYLDTNDPEAWREVDNMLAGVRGFDPAERNRLVSEYMAADTEGAQLIAAKNAEVAGLNHIGQMAGLTREEMDGIVGENMAQRDAVRAMIKNKAYSTAKDANGVRVDFMGHDNDAVSIMPVVASQLAEKIPLTDMTVMQKAIDRNRSLIKAVTGYNLGHARDVSVQTADVLSQVWKISNFARLGYLVRVVSDDGLAYMAKMDAMTALKPFGRGIINTGLNQAYKGALKMARTDYRLGQVGNVAEAALAKRGIGRGDWLLNPNPVPSLQDAQKIPEGLTRQAFDENAKKAVGQSDTTLNLRDANGNPVQVTAQGFAPPTALGNYWRKLASEDRTHMEQYGSQRLDRLRRTLSWNLVNKGDANYNRAYAHAVNKQLGQDAMARLILTNKTDGQIINWLTKDPEGQQYAARLPFWSADKADWVSRVRNFVDHYIPDTPFYENTTLQGQPAQIEHNLRALALKGQVNDDIIKMMPDSMKPDQVHGAMLDYNMGKGSIIQTAQRIQEGFYNKMNQMPTDVLIRHPLAQALYSNRLKELAQNHLMTGQDVDNDTLRMFETAARKHAIKNINQVVLDLGRHSNGAHMFRFVMPFYNAWEQALTRWGRLVYSDPSVLFKGNRLWQGMSNMPIMFDPQQGRVTDQNGNTLFGNEMTSVKNPDGTVSLKPSGQFKHGFSGLNNALNQVMTFRMPKAMADAMGFQTDIAIPKSSLNLVLQGDPWWLPSFGPVVQATVGGAVKRHPELQGNFQEVLPFGPQSLGDTLMPTSMKKLAAFIGDKPGAWLQDPEAEATGSINIWRQMYTQWMADGRQGPAPRFDDKEVAKRSARMRGLAFFTQMLSPVSAQYTTPNKFYIDQYRKLVQAQGPIKGRDSFLSQYPDFFLYADSISKNNAGVPATSNAYYNSQKYRDLIAKNPDIAGAIVSSGPQYQTSPGQQFNPSVYQEQFQQQYASGSTKTMREHQDLASFATNALVQRGWDQYSKMNNLIQVELTRRGLKSLSQTGAEDLQEAHRLLTIGIANQNQDWWKEYASFDPTKQQRVVEQLTNMVTDKHFMAGNANREEIANLANYLQARNYFIGQLANRYANGGSATMQANSNTDLYQMWNLIRDQLVHDKPTFQTTFFDRYLVRDDNLTYDPHYTYPGVQAVIK
jgi:hypothetical protein